MLGAIIGDIVGSPYEFRRSRIKTTSFPLFSPKSHFTDDTVMTIAVGMGVMEGHGNPEATQSSIVHAMKMYGKHYWKAGYGQKFFHWLFSDNSLPYNSFGNGSAMRVSTIAWAYKNLRQVEQYAAISAEVSHNHPEGIKGACATAAAIYLARSAKNKQEILSYIQDQYEYNLQRTLRDIRPGYEHIESCQESVPEAIIAFLESSSFESAIRNAVSLGGDSDTLAAIAGSIAEAFYGPIPQDIVGQAMQRLDAPLQACVVQWQDWLHRQN